MTTGRKRGGSCFVVLLWGDHFVLRCRLAYYLFFSAISHFYFQREVVKDSACPQSVLTGVHYFYFCADTLHCLQVAIEKLEHTLNNLVDNLGLLQLIFIVLASFQRSWNTVTLKQVRQGMKPRQSDD